MFALFDYVLLSFRAREIPEKFETQEPVEIIVECTSYTWHLYVYMNTQDRAIKFGDTYIIMQIFQQYDHNNYIKSSASRNDNFAALSLSWVTEYSTINDKDTSNIIFTTVYSPTSMLQTSLIYQMVFLCVPIPSVMWS